MSFDGHSVLTAKRNCLGNFGFMKNICMQLFWNLGLQFRRCCLKNFQHQLWWLFCLAERNRLGKFGRVTYEEHLCNNFKFWASNWG